MRKICMSGRGLRVKLVALVVGLFLTNCIVPTYAGDRDVTDSRGGGGHENNQTINWDTNHPAPHRFVSLAAFHHQAVLDRNTGLVWEQAPALDFLGSFGEATSYCVNKTVGGTRGWRLPSVVELASLIDPSLSPPFVPTNVFTGLQGTSFTGYWSATTVSDSPDRAWRVIFGSGLAASNGHKSGDNHFPGVFLSHAWCVRAGMNADVY